jgi:starvation-inducible DNA-binding protein
MEFNIGLDEDARQKISDSLHQLLADTYAVYIKTQNFHWNVVGPDFFSLHLLFEKQYEEMSQALDEIAERMRALGFYVDASFTAFKKMSSVLDENRMLPAKDMLLHLVKAHESVIRHARHLAKEAEEENDQATVDLCARRLGAHEKMAWMLRSHLT